MEEKKKSLMVLLDERHEIANKLEAAEDPVEELEQNTSDIQVKTAGISLYCRIGEDAIDQLDAQIRRLQERKKIIRARIDRVKDYTLTAMQMHGLRKIECPECTISIQKNPPSVEVFEEKLIPNEYWKQPEPVLDKKSLLDDLKDGVVIQGCCLKQNEGLRIR